jgi:hypothetical protein
VRHVHYVATLQVKRVEYDDGRNSSGQPSVAPGPKKVGDVASLTIRGADLEVLKGKVKDHLLVVDDDLNIPLDDVLKPQVRGNIR